jgi:hypothetical protein
MYFFLKIKKNGTPKKGETVFEFLDLIYSRKNKTRECTCSRPTVNFLYVGYLLGTSLLLSLSNLSDVEGKLLTLEDVSVGAARLTGARSKTGIETTSLELLIKSGVNLALLQTLGNLVLKGVRDLLTLTNNDLGGVLGGLSVGSGGRGGSGSLGNARGDSVVLLVPLLEGGSVNLDDGSLDEGVGTDQLVRGGVVSDTEDTALTGGGLRGPGEVTGLKTESAELVVATAGADEVDLLGANLGVGGLTAKLELSLLAHGNLLTSGKTALVGGVTRDT